MSTADIYLVYEMYPAINICQYFIFYRIQAIRQLGYACTFSNLPEHNG